MIIATLVRIGDPYSGDFTSYEEDITIGDVTYEGARDLGFGSVEYVEGLPDNRTQLIVHLIEGADYQNFAVDRGPASVTIGWAVSVNQGQTWRALSRTFGGKVSYTQIEGRTMSIEIETEKGDSDRTGTKYWSHAQQQIDFPGDRGLEHMRQISEGIALPRPR